MLLGFGRNVVGLEEIVVGLKEDVGFGSILGF